MSSNVKNFLGRLGVDFFVLAIFASLLLAWLYPSFGIDGGAFSLRNIAEVGVGLIFFFYGLRLNLGRLKVGLKNVRLHLLIHLSTFIFAPLLVLAAMMIFETPQYHILWLGAFFLAALPSTVSTSVVMVSIAGGNIPAAIFNASISSLLGVFVTPLWMLVFISSASGSGELYEIFLKLIMQVIVPIVAGISLNRFFGGFAERHKKASRLFDQTIVVLIAYTSFCASFAGGMFENFRLAELAVLVLGMLLLFIILYFGIMLACRLLKFDRADTITAEFCGSKKSLMHGSVMSKVIFQDAALTGVILLPTLIYHAMQIIIVSAIARSCSRKTERTEG